MWKWIKVGLGIGIGLLVISVLFLVGVYYFADKVTAPIEEAIEFGKTHTKLECLNKAIEDFEKCDGALCGSKMSMFLTGCLYTPNGEAYDICKGQDVDLVVKRVCSSSRSVDDCSNSIMPSILVLCSKTETKN